jgi:hypothetical protein
MHTKLDKLSHGGVELPVYYTNDIVDTKAGMQELSTDRSVHHMVRGVFAGLRRSRISSLGEFLQKADQTFTSIAAHCGAMVVSHEWGLSPAAEELRQDWMSVEMEDIIPPNHRLVAKVDVLHGITPLSPGPTRTVRRALTRHKSDTNACLRWDDSYPYQFVEHDSGIVLLDIDPEFAGTES